MIFNEYSKSLCSMSFKSSFIVRKNTVRNIIVLGDLPTVDDADVPAVIHIGEQDVDSNEPSNFVALSRLAAANADWF